MSSNYHLYNWQPGMRLELRKAHPCGGRSWMVLRTGAEILLRCETCHYQQKMARRKLEASVSRIIEGGEEVPV